MWASFLGCMSDMVPVAWDAAQDVPPSPNMEVGKLQVGLTSLSWKSGCGIFWGIGEYTGRVGS